MAFGRDPNGGSVLHIPTRLWSLDPRETKQRLKIGNSGYWLKCDTHTPISKLNVVCGGNSKSPTFPGGPERIPRPGVPQRLGFRV